MQIHLNIAGGFSKFHILNSISIPSNTQISVYDGVLHPWSGGRILKYNKKFSEKIIKYYNNKGIKFFIALSNHYIDIGDTEGIAILDFLNKTSNGVILCNQNLNKLIQSNYPNISTIYSITGHSNDANDFSSAISLESEYNLVVPRFEWIFNSDFLAIANTAKYEIMLNDTCVYGCKYWNDHFRAISRSNAFLLPGNDDIQECWIPRFEPSIQSNHECMDLDFNAIQKAINLGYSNFKFSGRENPDSSYRLELEKYIGCLASVAISHK